MSTSFTSIVALCGIIVMVLGLLSGCDKTRKNVFAKMLELERAEYKGQDLSEATEEEIKEAIRRFEKTADSKVEANEQLGLYYKLLTVKYMDREMYGLALESLEEAIYYYPENPILFHLGGVCAARMGKSSMDPNESEAYYQLAEDYYSRAVELDARYVDALYGLSVLYVFELDRPFDAEPLLEKVLMIQKKNIDAMFLLARIYVEYGNIEDAMELYETIEETSSDPLQQKEAAANRRTLLEGEL